MLNQNQKNQNIKSTLEGFKSLDENDIIYILNIQPNWLLKICNIMTIEEQLNTEKWIILN